MKIFSQLWLFVFFSSFAPTNSSLIDWNSERRLTWDDFKANPDKNSPNAALTGTNIKFDFSYSSDRGFQYHITCQFDKNKSWGRVKTDYILAHEQGHFDIAEIYARKLNKVLKAYKPDENNLSKDVNKIYEKMMKAYYDEQEVYDKETNFSINHAKQEEWLRKISEDLKDLKDYSNYN